MIWPVFASKVGKTLLLAYDLQQEQLNKCVDGAKTCLVYEKTTPFGCLNLNMACFADQLTSKQSFALRTLRSKQTRAKKPWHVTN
eukprot:595954-Amphidinium_carterae.1